LSIQFRFDERRFDVDGAYNVRYEIIKKRIDKAVVQGTRERVTQPRKLAIVYSQPAEAAEYRAYLEYLGARGYVTGEVEDHALRGTPGRPRSAGACGSGSACRRRLLRNRGRPGEAGQASLPR
jgi:hypothetical protein